MLLKKTFNNISYYIYTVKLNINIALFISWCLYFTKNKLLKVLYCWCICVICLNKKDTYLKNLVILKFLSKWTNLSQKGSFHSIQVIRLHCAVLNELCLALKLISIVLKNKYSYSD